MHSDTQISIDVPIALVLSLVYQLRRVRGYNAKGRDIINLPSN